MNYFSFVFLIQKASIWVSLYPCITNCCGAALAVRLYLMQSDSCTADLPWILMFEPVLSTEMTDSFISECDTAERVCRWGHLCAWVSSPATDKWMLWMEASCWVCFGDSWWIRVHTNNVLHCQQEIWLFKFSPGFDNVHIHPLIRWKWDVMLFYLSLPNLICLFWFHALVVVLNHLLSVTMQPTLTNTTSAFISHKPSLTLTVTLELCLWN